MEQNIDHNKIELKDKLISFYKLNKTKIYVFLVFLIIALFLISFFKQYNQKKMNLVAEKYIEAGLYLNTDQAEKSKDIYEEIIFNKNKFYSILALNTILEEGLETDNLKILEYFEFIEIMKITKEQKDLIIFKKALFMIKISKAEEGKVLLKNLIKKNSKFKSLAEEILNK
jgi:hypothetical protein